MMLHRLFFIVEAVPLGGDDFEIFGVFSKREDAEAQAADLEESGTVVLKRSTVVESGVAMEAIKRQLVKDRLGEMAASIDRLLGAKVPASS